MDLSVEERKRRIEDLEREIEELRDNKPMTVFRVNQNDPDNPHLELDFEVYACWMDGDSSAGDMNGPVAVTSPDGSTLWRIDRDAWMKIRETFDEVFGITEKEKDNGSSDVQQ